MKTAMSAPVDCPACGHLVRRVVDVDVHADLVIDAAQVGADVGNVSVITVARGTGLWLVECRDQAGPPGPPERYVTEVPPALFSVHVCPPVAALELDLADGVSA